MSQLRGEQAKLERDYAEKLNLFKPEWPAMQQLKIQDTSAVVSRFVRVLVLGAVAVADAASRGESAADIGIEVRGGRLRVVWQGPNVILSGPARIVAAGRWLG